MDLDAWSGELELEGDGMKPPRAVRLRLPTPQPTEKECQRAVVTLFSAAGCQVYNLSQARASKQTPGLPDLWVFCPRRKCAWWWETKRPGGQLRREQREFRQRCMDAGVRYEFGGVPEAIVLLKSFQLVAHRPGPLERCCRSPG